MAYNLGVNTNFAPQNQQQNQQFSPQIDINNILKNIAQQNQQKQTQEAYNMSQFQQLAKQQGRDIGGGEGLTPGFAQRIANILGESNGWQAPQANMQGQMQDFQKSAQGTMKKQGQQQPVQPVANTAQPNFEPQVDNTPSIEPPVIPPSTFTSAEQYDNDIQYLIDNGYPVQTAKALIDQKRGFQSDESRRPNNVAMVGGGQQQPQQTQQVEQPWSQQSDDDQYIIQSIRNTPGYGHLTDEQIRQLPAYGSQYNEMMDYRRLQRPDENLIAKAVRLLQGGK